MYLFLIFYTLHYICYIPTNIIFKYRTLRYSKCSTHLETDALHVSILLLWSGLVILWGLLYSWYSRMWHHPWLLSFTLHPVRRQIYCLYLQNVSRIWSPLSTFSATILPKPPSALTQRTESISLILPPNPLWPALHTIAFNNIAQIMSHVFIVKCK